MQKNKLPKVTSCRSDAKSRSRSFHHGNLRQELIDAALAAPEIEALSLRQLAASLGVTAAAAYRHFDSREDLLFEVACCGFDRLRQGFAEAFDIELPPSNAEEARQRLIRLAQAYLQFSDDEPALWRLMFGAQAEAYRKTANVNGRLTSYDYLPAALLGLHLRGVIPAPPHEHDALFAWSAIHGAASLRSGRVPAALLPMAELAQAVAGRVILALQQQPLNQETLT
jgi:AcrR family transcriptional regulator